MYLATFATSLSIALLLGNFVAANPIEVRETAPPSCATILCPVGTACTVVDGAVGCKALGSTVDACSTVRCAGGKVCQVVGGKATCVAPEAAVCGTNVCPGGETCCNASCGICAPPDGACTQQFCESGPPPPPSSTTTTTTGPTCGNTTCPTGQHCCNASCGICVAPGGACTQQVCEREEGALGAAQACGATACGSGEYCCNESCGICAPLGESCIQQFCSPSSTS